MVYQKLHPILQSEYPLNLAHIQKINLYSFIHSSLAILRAIEKITIKKGVNIYGYDSRQPTKIIKS